MKANLKFHLFFVLCILFMRYGTYGQSNNCLTEGDVGYNPPRGLTDPGVVSEHVEGMKLSDKTDHKCLFGMRAVFNNDGLGILCGYKIGNPTGKRDVLFGEEYIYHFYLYKSTDGLKWNLIEDQKIKNIFTDTVGYAGFKSNNPRYGLFSDGKNFYLTDLRKPSKSGILEYYSTSNGDKWEKIELRDKELSGVYSFSIYNTEVPAIIGNYGWPGRNIGIFSKPGNEWELVSPNYFPSELNFIAWQGRQISYNQINGYLFAGKEKPYFLYNTASDQTLLVLGQSNEPNNDSRYKNREFNWYVYPKSVHMSHADPKTVYADFGNLGIYKSINGGNTFKKLADWPGIGSMIKIYPICDDGTIFTGIVNMGGTSIFRSDDGGESWKGIARVSHNTICEVDVLPNGTTVLITNTGVWRLKEGCKKSELIELEYGTTIITHGTNIDFFDSYEHWTDRMAVEILKKAEYGNVYKYQPETGEYIKMIDAKNGRPGEDIIIFDWSAECALYRNGFVEAAADALFSSLLLARQKGQFKLKNIHFIGHGRGCIVNSLAVERLLALNDREISFSQVTNLGPMDSNYPIDRTILDWIAPDFNDLNDAHPEIDIAEPAYNRPNNGVIAWRGIFSDTYYQKNGKLILHSSLAYLDEMRSNQFVDNFINFALKEGFNELADRLRIVSQYNRNRSTYYLYNSFLDEIQKERAKLFELRFISKLTRITMILDAYFLAKDIIFSNVDSRPVAGSLNIEWSSFNGKKVIHDAFGDQTTFPEEYFQTYIGICDAYIKSIQSSRHGIVENEGGYSYSRLNGYTGRNNPNQGFKISKFDFYKGPSMPNEIDKIRISGVFNGSFDRIPESEFSLGRMPELHFRYDAPGWLFHGGGYYFEKPGLIVYNIPTRSVKLQYAQKTTPILLKHNRMYIPNDANSLSFFMRTDNVKNGNLKVNFEDANTKAITFQEIKDIGLIDNFQETMVDIRHFRGKVISFAFEFSCEKNNSDAITDPYIELDEVKLSKSTAPAFPHVSVKTEASTDEKSITSTPPELQAESITTDLSKVSFSTNWTHTTGQVTFKNGMAILETSKKNPIAKITQQALNVPEEVTYLEVSLRTLNVKNGTFSIIAQEIATGNVKAESLEIKSEVLKFSSIQLDISSFRNKQISLSFSFKGDVLSEKFLAKLELKGLKVH